MRDSFIFRIFLSWARVSEPRCRLTYISSSGGNLRNLHEKDCVVGETPQTRPPTRDGNVCGIRSQAYLIIWSKFDLSCTSYYDKIIIIIYSSYMH